MSEHAAVEHLSSYLDAELPQAERARIERHLEDCAPCRERLEGLRNVVDRLEKLRRAAPPTYLGRSIEQSIRLEVRREGLLQRLERRIERWTTHSAMMPIFALVVALAVIIYLFALGVERSSQRTRIILEPSQVAPSSDSIEVGGRIFDLEDSVWIERGLAGESVSVYLRFPGVEADRWRDRIDLGAYRALGGVVRLRVGDEVLEVDYSPSARP